VSLTPAQRAQVLYLYQVEGVSIVLIAVMTGLSRSAVTRVLQQARRQDATAEEKAAAMRPSSKGKVERQIHVVRAHLLREETS
jgi:DNA-directed RNA polymerase specialized sigma24 family protein